MSSNSNNTNNSASIPNNFPPIRLYSDYDFSGPGIMDTTFSGLGLVEAPSSSDEEYDYTYNYLLSNSSPRCPGMLDVTNNETPKKDSEFKHGGLTGLRNIGNTCFMNSILQCLSNTKPLLNPMLKKFAKVNVNTNSKMKGEIFMAFGTLLKDLWNGHRKQKYPADTSQLKDKIQKFCPTFQGYHQHDAQELLRFLLEGLHYDINRVTDKPEYTPLIFPIGSSDEQKAAIAWKKTLEHENSPISDIFMGQLKSSLTCLSCGHRSLTFDPFWDLSIPLPSASGTLLLTDALSFFTHEETLSGHETPLCEGCGEHTSATKRMTIQKFPEVLVLHLKRFQQQERGKLRTVVKFPLTNLDMGVYSDPSVNSCAYNLFGISSHFGTLRSGHYVAYAKHPYTNEWHQYDDARVIPCDADDIENVEAYLLFYELSMASKSCMIR